VTEVDCAMTKNFFKRGFGNSNSHNAAPSVGMPPAVAGNRGGYSTPSPPPPPPTSNTNNHSNGGVAYGTGVEVDDRKNGSNTREYYHEGTSNNNTPSSMGSRSRNRNTASASNPSREGRSSSRRRKGESTSRRSPRSSSSSNRRNQSGAGRSSSDRISSNIGTQNNVAPHGMPSQQRHSSHRQIGVPPPSPTVNGTANNNHHQTPPQSSHSQVQSIRMPQGQQNTQDHMSVTSSPYANAVTGYSSSANQDQASHSVMRRPAYLLHRDLVIGKGSYGQVCIASRGEAEGHGRSGGKRKKFACKCVVLRNDPKYIAKLQEEVNVLRELRGHDNIIRLYDVFCVDNELFIITELGRGGDLFHLLTTHPKHGVTEAYAAKTVAQMLSAVAFLHARTICHRDLKLENWVLESGRDVWSPLKLIDFGLSTHYIPGHRLSRVVGSSYYVAPEVLKKSYTEACDLWSLGVIVYMLLSGAPPFYGKNDEAIKASIVNGEYTFPHELFRDVSDEAMAFVSTLLSYNTDYRYTADQALTHPWLAANCEPEQLQKAIDGSRGVGVAQEDTRPEPMQM